MSKCRVCGGSGAVGQYTIDRLGVDDDQCPSCGGSGYLTCVHGTRYCPGQGDKHACYVPSRIFDMTNRKDAQAVRCLHLVISGHAHVDSYSIEHNGEYSTVDMKFISKARMTVGKLDDYSNDGLGSLFKVLAMQIAKESGLPETASEYEMYEWAAGVLMNEANKVR